MILLSSIPASPILRLNLPCSRRSISSSISRARNSAGGRERYAAAIFRVKPAATTAQVVVAVQVASLFLLNPGGEVASHLSMDQIGIYQPKNDPYSVVLNARITNDGNLHISRDQIWGMIHVMDEDGYLIDSFEVNTHTMLPDNSYTHKEVWAAPGYLSSGTYQFHLTLLVFEPLGTEPQRYFLTIPVDLQF
ncbi:MAG: hypothetical protein U9N00_03305 [Candidatus Bipolaricaulota bacterium]|nr:hypothetical protein [Candidatus Bipolaricaulota bacterium]